MLPNGLTPGSRERGLNELAAIRASLGCFSGSRQVELLIHATALIWQWIDGSPNVLHGYRGIGIHRKTKVSCKPAETPVLGFIFKYTVMIFSHADWKEVP